MKLYMLGTGNALAAECYNTCFVMEDEGRYFMVDGGGGNGILKQLKDAGLNWMDMKDIFVTHKHLDHIMGIVWMIRMICQFMRSGNYEGEARIYAHEEVIGLLREMAFGLLQRKDTAFIDDRLHFITLEDGEKEEIIGRSVTFFDIHSTKAKQFGFRMELEKGRYLTCCGDEPYNDSEEKYCAGAEWMLHEAFCLYGERDIFDPYEKHHSTVKDACETAERLGVGNLVLYHTEDKNLQRRRELYSAEGSEFFHGKLYVPEDLEILDIG